MNEEYPPVIGDYEGDGSYNSKLADLRNVVRDYVDRYEHTTDYELRHAICSALSPDEERILAREMVRVWIHLYRRGNQREVERESQKKAARKKLVAGTGTPAARKTIEEIKERRVTRERTIRENIKELIEAYAVEIDLDLNDNLLDSEFALGDGTVVTWRNATETDHMIRAEMLEKKAGGIAESAMRHRRAIQILHEKHVETLGDI
jgi:hypothetical protein